MITSATLVRPKRLQGLYQPSLFIPPNSSDQLLKIDMGFSINPIYKQEKLCLFLPANIYYQQLKLVDGKGNNIPDDARTLVICGRLDISDGIIFGLDFDPGPPPHAAINTKYLPLPFYPELGTGIVVQEEGGDNQYYYFTCSRILHRPAIEPYLQLKYAGSFNQTNLPDVLSKWHPDPIEAISPDR